MANSLVPEINAVELNLGYQGALVIKNASFKIMPCEFVFITGVSGSGKSTLLRSMYGNLPIISGFLTVRGYNLANAKKAQITRLRREIGIVFQDYKLIKEWSVERNISFPMLFSNKVKKSEIKERTEFLLSHIEMTHKARKFPLQLSGGEQQRVALARAMASAPSVIFADEPTGNLDDYSSDRIWRILSASMRQLKTTVIVVTHRIPENINAKYRHFHIEDSRIYEMD